MEWGAVRTTPKGLLLFNRDLTQIWSVTNLFSINGNLVNKNKALRHCLYWGSHTVVMYVKWTIGYPFPSSLRLTDQFFITVYLWADKTFSTPIEELSWDTQNSHKILGIVVYFSCLSTRETGPCGSPWALDSVILTLSQKYERHLMCTSGLHMHSNMCSSTPPPYTHSVSVGDTQFVFFAMWAAREPREWEQAKAFLLWTWKINN